MPLIMRLIVGFTVDRFVLIAVLFLIGLLLVGAHGADQNPVLAEQQIE